MLLLIVSRFMQDQIQASWHQLQNPAADNYPLPYGRLPVLY